MGRDADRRRYAAAVMTSDSLNDRLVQSLLAARDKEAALLARVDDAPSVEADVWTAKDNVAHLNAWREHAARTLVAVRLGMPFEGPAVDTDVDASNAVIYEAHRGDSADAVRAAYDGSYSALIEAINACAEEDLLCERPDNGGAVWLVVPGNGHGHTAQHLTYWAFDHGDAEGAEEAAKWSNEIELGAAPREQACRRLQLRMLLCAHSRCREGVAAPRRRAASSSRPARVRARGRRPRTDPRRSPRRDSPRPLKAGHATGG